MSTVKDIPGWNGYYSITDTGEVYSNKRAVVTSNGVLLTIRQRRLRPAFTTGGYLMVVLSRNGKTTSVAVHSLMAITFLSPPSVRLPEVDHINRIKTDNRLENLRWVDISVNRHNASESKRNTSGVRGVSWCKRRNKWRARMEVRGVVIIELEFSDFQDAVAERKRAEREFWKGVA